MTISFVFLTMTVIALWLVYDLIFTSLPRFKHTLLKRILCDFESFAIQAVASGSSQEFADLRNRMPLEDFLAELRLCLSRELALARSHEPDRRQAFDLEDGSPFFRELRCMMESYFGGFEQALIEEQCQQLDHEIHDYPLSQHDEGILQDRAADFVAQIDFDRQMAFIGSTHRRLNALFNHLTVPRYFSVLRQTKYRMLREAEALGILLREIDLQGLPLSFRSDQQRPQGNILRHLASSLQRYNRLVNNVLDNLGAITGE